MKSLTAGFFDLATLPQIEHLKELADLILGISNGISFHILEIGAVPLEGHDENFYQLLDLFPGSKIFGFELDDELCRELNKNAKHGLHYFPTALGRTEETRQLYETVHPMCSSLYRPNEEFLSQYDKMDVAMLKKVSSIETISLDRFAQDNFIQDIDFIKIDVQGAELDIFQGGTNTLKDVVMVVSEVEFVPLYIDQPLFGDVCKFLMKSDLMFQNFLNIGRRVLKPFIFSDPNKGSHFIWADALFTRNILRLSELSIDKLLKMAVLSFLYGFPDFAIRCISIVDARQRTNIGQKFIDIMGIPRR